MRKIFTTIKIDCLKKYCDDCSFLNEFSSPLDEFCSPSLEPTCLLFDKPLKESKNGNAKRLKKCKYSEKTI